MFLGRTEEGRLERARHCRPGWPRVACLFLGNKV